MTSYPMHLTASDIADDIHVCRETVNKWIRDGQIIGVLSVYRYVVTGYHYIQFLMKKPKFKEISKYYKTYQSYMRRKNYVQKNKKESRDDS